MGDVSWSREGAGWELWQPETEWHGSKKPSYSRQDPPSSSLLPPKSQSLVKNIWSVFGVFCYGLVSCNLCLYLFVRACHIWCATAGNPRVKDKALSWPSSCPCTHVSSAHVPSAHVPSAHVPSAHVPSAHLLSAHVPMYPTKMESLISDVLPNIGQQKTRAFTKEKRRKRTTRKWFPSTCIISPGHPFFIFIVQAIVR